MIKNTALIAGGNGIIGRNLAQYLTSTGVWDVIVTSRSPLSYTTTADYVSLDLNDAGAVGREREKLKNVTHVFFAAYTEKHSPYEQSGANLALMKNLIEGLEITSPNLKRVVFIQGGKAYGAHLGFYKTPAKETDLRSITPNFYYDQEDFLRELSKGKGWSWTAIRPDIVIGFTVGNPMNLLNLIAVYASLCKEENIPMRFPGSLKAYNVLVNITSAEVLAKAMEWAALNDKAKEEIFNITNGDVFRWEQLWPKIGDFFGIPVAEPQTFLLQEYMPGKRELWEKMITKYKLEPHSLDRLVQWGFGDFIFNVESDAFQDVNKARRFGFHEMQIDSTEDILLTLSKLKGEKIIP
ncbi:MAG TPA: SDR family oxidoreductase [Dysgonomonas sp.]|uniref:SDR family oxidoreductase n=1 Tax=unclassified Dysgonomonas TaxID=2630389 RepID=UPI0025BE844F|nr:MULTISPECIES: SDR family oxidoreductase [unclassified Dysgonomonas]HML65200.1 SDR family oxidoreductase [Dysgonomonas sp.]